MNASLATVALRQVLGHRSDGSETATVENGSRSATGTPRFGRRRSQSWPLELPHPVQGY